ncbi:MAG: undecaprenyl/decaprenyl-phosphate alpha-N-acetylglucosaminyl 1-phosphate transferase [Salinisphaera sp.]|nr:undecaprenyl/decaprenyl-phosphate alpha-N-acetylglucosaminyl 1-phosphate transferase [Salinisphaera sp.]
MLEASVLIFSLIACAALIRASRGLCLRLGHVDRPGGHKHHDQPTPLCGGLAIVLTVLVAGAFIGFSQGYVGLALGMIVLAAVGAMDDARHLPAAIRLAAQALAVLVGMVLVGDVGITSLGHLFGSAPVTLDTLAIAFTVFAVVGVLNAINMIDGVDGLAGGYGLLVLVILAAAQGLTGAAGDTLIYAFIGALLAFLACNMRTPWRRRAGIFLGDAGSLMLGFALTWFAVSCSQGQTPALRPITMVWLFGLPLADAGFLIIARLVSNGSPMRADRRHFHHLLLQRGLSPGQTCWAWLAVAALFMLVGLAGEWGGVAEVVMCYGYCAVFAAYCILNGYLWSRTNRPRRETMQSRAVKSG